MPKGLKKGMSSTRENFGRGRGSEMFGRGCGSGGRGREDGIAGGFTRGESTERHLEEDEDLPEPVYAVLDEQENTDGRGASSAPGFAVSAEQEETDGYRYDENQPTELPELTQDMKMVIRRAVRSKGEVLVDAHIIQITVEDINTLKDLEWLNDKVIDFYMQVC